MTVFRTLALIACLLLTLGCSPQSPSSQSSSEPAPVLTLATTTSTRDSGLLDVLKPMFEQLSGVQLKVIAVGSGQALEIGRRGDADVLLTHAPQAEKQFVEQGHAQRRQAVMHNDFVLLGPATDPAGLATEKSIVAALARIAKTASPFVSRGDNSGTHMKERNIWLLSEVEPQGDWYIEAGSSMVAILRIANEKRAYTLSDRGTYLAHREQLELEIISQGDPLLANYYSVMVISQDRHPHVHRQAAQQFADFLISPQVQKMIAQFGVDQYGEPLFFVD